MQTGKNESIVARIKDFEQKIANAKNFLQSFEQQATAKTVTEKDVKNKLIQLREYMENPENFARRKHCKKHHDEGICERGFAPDRRKSVLSRVRYESYSKFVGNPTAEKTHYPI